MFKWIKNWLAYKKDCWYVIVYDNNNLSPSAIRRVRDNDFKEGSVNRVNNQHVAHVTAYNHEEAEAKGRDLVIQHRNYYHGRDVSEEYPVEVAVPQEAAGIRRSAIMDYVGEPTEPAIQGLTVDDLRVPEPVSFFQEGAWNDGPQLGQMRYVVESESNSGGGLYMWNSREWVRVVTSDMNGTVIVTPQVSCDHIKFELGVAEKEDRCRKLVVHK